MPVHVFVVISISRLETVILKTNKFLILFGFRVVLKVKGGGSD
jgi:hypothetical protein